MALLDERTSALSDQHLHLDECNVAEGIVPPVPEPAIAFMESARSVAPRPLAEVQSPGNARTRVRIRAGPPTWPVTATARRCAPLASCGTLVHRSVWPCFEARTGIGDQAPSRLSGRGQLSVLHSVARHDRRVQAGVRVGTNRRLVPGLPPAGDLRAGTMIPAKLASGLAPASGFVARSEGAAFLCNRRTLSRRRLGLPYAVDEAPVAHGTREYRPGHEGTSLL